MSIPFSAPFPVPTIIAVGVARPRAHGQDTTSIAIPIDIAKSALFPVSAHIIVAATAIVITAGTNIPLTLSASLDIGALEADASSTSLIIPARAVSSPTFSARILNEPAPFTVAPVTFEPVVFSTGMLSPVTADSSTYELPSITTPSTGMLAPGFMSMTSPTFKSFVALSFSSPFISTIAVFGARSMSLDIASLVFPLDLSSRNLPRFISVRIIAEVSKYKSMA